MFVVFAPASGIAQDNDTLTDVAAPRVIYQAVNIVDFEERRVDASVEKPTLQYVSEFDLGRHKPLIQLRVSWDDELGRSVDEVK